MLKIIKSGARIRVGAPATNLDAVELMESLGFKLNPKSIRTFAVNNRTLETP